MKKHFPTILLIIILLIGTSLLMYPSFSDYWNSLHQTNAIAGYVQSVAMMDDNKYNSLLSEAKSYNERIAMQGQSFQLSDTEYEEYGRMLDVDGSGIMGYIEIDSIGCSLPIYHGTDKAVLQIAVGHIAGSSLPIGGESSHCVLSGHRGLPSAKIFSNLDKLMKGDTFVIQTLKSTLTYEVDQIMIVSPTDISALAVEKDKDLCTLITCTPYGVNSHRLLVRGHRIENSNTSSVRIVSDATVTDPTIVAVILAVPTILFIYLLFIINARHKAKRNTVRKKIGITDYKR